MERYMSVCHSHAYLIRYVAVCYVAVCYVVVVLFAGRLMLASHVGLLT